MRYAKILLILFTYLVGGFVMISCQDSNTSDTLKEVLADSVISYPPGKSKIRDITSFDLVDEMGVGWNLGNSFDVTSADKTYWGNPLPNKDIIDEVAKMGFKTLRIPITWGFHQQTESPYSIDNSYLSAIESVVNYGFENKMHVIINVHHDEDWVVPDRDHIEESKKRLASLWTQVAEHFIDYNDSLIFEILNEPRIKDIAQEWTGGTSEGRQYINELHQVALDTIRATGENNSLRHIMICPWAASTVPIAMEDLVIPNQDSKVIISLHSYFPWSFAGEAKTTWGTEKDQSDLAGELERIKEYWIVSNNRPVVLGEWGSIEKNNLEERQKYAEFYCTEATKRGLLTIVWDDGGNFRLFDRHSLTWDYENIAKGIVSVFEGSK